MTMEKQQFEDVYPVKIGDLFSIASHVSLLKSTIGQDLSRYNLQQLPTFVLGPVNTSKTFSQGSSTWSWPREPQKILG